VTYRPADSPAGSPTFCTESVQKALVDWYQRQGRSFPWRLTNDAYHVLVAVFMLQRTGVSQVMNVYERFVERYPNLEAIAEANEQELAEVLRPLGRVDRLPVLRALVDTLLEEYGGHIPEDLESLDALPGIGQYSSRAVMCLAFGRPCIMLDPNSYRVLSRACGFATDKTRPHTDKELIRALDALVQAHHPQAFNLALLDVGSKICRKQKPRHEECPLQDVCLYVRREG